jgi:hypothetical protein
LSGCSGILQQNLVKNSLRHIGDDASASTQRFFRSGQAVQFNLTRRNAVAGTFGRLQAGRRSSSTLSWAMTYANDVIQVEGAGHDQKG